MWTVRADSLGMSEIAKENIAKSVHLQAEHDAAEPVRETVWLQAIADNPTCAASV